MYLHFSNTFYSLFYNFALIVDFKAQTNNKAYQGALSNRKRSELIETDFNEHIYDLVSINSKENWRERPLVHYLKLICVLD